MTHTTLMQRFKEGQEEFLASLAVQRDLSKNTLRAYHKDLEGFLTWLTEQPDLFETDAPPAETLRRLPSLYTHHLHGRQLAKSSIARKLSALKMFFRYLLKEQDFRAGRALSPISWSQANEKAPSVSDARGDQPDEAGHFRGAIGLACPGTRLICGIS